MMVASSNKAELFRLAGMTESVLRQLEANERYMAQTYAEREAAIRQAEAMRNKAARELADIRDRIAQKRRSLRLLNEQMANCTQK